MLTGCVIPTEAGRCVKEQAMETTTFMKPKFVISALPGTGVMQVQVKASCEKPAPRTVVLQTAAGSSMS